MKKIIILAVGLLFLTTSCLEIVEEITVNRDLSGRIEYKINSNDIGFLFESFSSMMDISIENQLKNEAKRLEEKLKTKTGIKNIKLNVGSTIKDFSFSFNFSDTKSLNEALYELGGAKKHFFSPGYLKIKKRRIKKINFAPYVKEYLERENISLPSSAITNLIKYKSIVHLPRPVKSSKGANLVSSQDKRKTEQTFEIQDIIDNKVNVKVNLKY